MNARRRAAVVLAVLLVAASASPVPAQTPDERDALIRELMRRIDLLERRVTAVQGAMQELGGGAAPEVTPAAARGAAAAGAAKRGAATTPVAEPLPGVTNGAPAVPPAAARKPTPGLLTIDEEAAERALERTLVQAGALLLPPGRAEVQPGFSFVRRKLNAPAFVELGDGAVVVAGEDEVRRNEFEPSLALRVGLPWDSQLELSVPYTIVDQTTVRTVAAGRSKSARVGHGLGDVEIGLAKTVLREGRYRPDLVARVAWDSNSGTRSNNQVPLAASVNELRGSITALKQQDPLAFFASASYTRPFTEDHIRPGDQLGFGLGVALAASPESSLSLAFNQSFTDDARTRGRVIEGSDQTQATIGVGVSTLLARNVLLSLTAGAGLTDDSPDYFVGVSLPVRFTVPAP